MASHADYRRSAHTLHAVHCHFVFCTKYRKPVLRGEIGQEVRRRIQQICQAHDIEILQGHVRPDIMFICFWGSRRTYLRAV